MDSSCELFLMKCAARPSHNFENKTLKNICATCSQATVVDLLVRTRETSIPYITWLLYLSNRITSNMCPRKWICRVFDNVSPTRVQEEHSLFLVTCRVIVCTRKAFILDFIHIHCIIAVLSNPVLFSFFPEVLLREHYWLNKAFKPYAGAAHSSCLCLQAWASGSLCQTILFRFRDVFCNEVSLPRLLLASGDTASCFCSASDSEQNVLSIFKSMQLKSGRQKSRINSNISSTELTKCIQHLQRDFHSALQSATPLQYPLFKPIFSLVQILHSNCIPHCSLDGCKTASLVASWEATFVNLWAAWGLISPCLYHSVRGRKGSLVFSVQTRWKLSSLIYAWFWSESKVMEVMGWNQNGRLISLQQVSNRDVKKRQRGPINIQSRFLLLNSYSHVLIWRNRPGSLLRDCFVAKMSFWLPSCSPLNKDCYGKMTSFFNVILREYIYE